MKPASIRGSLLLRCGVGVGALLCLLFVATYLLVRQSLFREIDHSISQTAALLANQVELEYGEVTFEWQEGLGSNDSLLLEGLFQFWDDHTGATNRSPALKAVDLPKFRGTNGMPELRTIQLPNGELARAVGLRVLPFVLPEEKARMLRVGEEIDPASLPHTLVVAASIAPAERTLAHLRYVLASGALLTLALGFTLIDQVIRLSLRPINELTLQMRERAEHQLDSALTLPGRFPRELSGLAETFDALLARVAAIRRREKDFIRHAAHELRTPIAGLKATTELALSQSRDAQAYEEHLRTCRDVSDELGELVKRLSALARVGTAVSPMEIIPLSPIEVIQYLLVSFMEAASQRGIRIDVGPCEDRVRFNGDPTLVRLVVNNLLDNATSYAPDHSAIRIGFETENDWARIVISNPADHFTDDPSSLFEPLFRGVASDPHRGNHLGIGLTLSLEAANAMGGTLHARKREDGWIEFVFGLPLARN
jgi:signal transduction histidine kinase